MPDPQLKFDKEELKLTISNLGGGWPIGQLGELSLFDQATVEFPSSWSQFKAGVAMQVVESQWRMSAPLVLTQTLETGVEFSRKDGTRTSLQLDNDLKYHLLERRTTQIDLYLNVKLEGKYDGSGFEGSGMIGLGIKGKF